MFILIVNYFKNHLLSPYWALEFLDEFIDQEIEMVEKKVKNHEGMGKSKLGILMGVHNKKHF